MAYTSKKCVNEVRIYPVKKGSTTMYLSFTKGAYALFAGTKIDIVKEGDTMYITEAPNRTIDKFTHRVVLPKAYSVDCIGVYTLDADANGKGYVLIPEVKPTPEPEKVTLDAEAEKTEQAKRLWESAEEVKACGREVGKESLPEAHTPDSFEREHEIFMQRLAACHGDVNKAREMRIHDMELLKERKEQEAQRKAEAERKAKEQAEAEALAKAQATNEIIVAEVVPAHVDDYDEWLNSLRKMLNEKLYEQVENGTDEHRRQLVAIIKMLG